MQEWISVKDRLPRDGRNNLVLCSALGGNGIGIMSYDTYSREWRQLTSIGVACYTYSVTHWMPLPQPPESKL